jgi:hypothetical protein
LKKSLSDRSAEPERPKPDDPANRGGPTDIGEVTEPDNVDTNAEAGLAVVPADPFDPEQLKLSQNFGATLGVQRALITVPVRKPAGEWWVRTHPDVGYRLETAVVELKDDHETYLVDRSLWDGLATEGTFSPRLILTAVNRQGTLFLWPIRMPGPDGRPNTWNQSAQEAAIMACGGWVRVRSNMNLGAYEVLMTSADIPDPIWPKESFRDLLEIAFRDRFIDHPDHPVLQRLRGEK